MSAGEVRASRKSGNGGDSSKNNSIGIKNGIGIDEGVIEVGDMEEEEEAVSDDTHGGDVSE